MSLRIAVFPTIVSILLLGACAAGLCVILLLLGNALNPKRPGPVKGMPYESGMDPIHDARRQFDVRFYLLAIAFLVFDVELLFLYPWAVASRRGGLIAEGTSTSAPAQGIDAAVAAGWVDSRGLVFAGVMVFIVLLILGLIYDWRKGVFKWR